VIYLDTSLLVSALTNEPDGSIARDWLAERPNEVLVVSHWVLVEFASALSAKLRNKDITQAEHTAALRELHYMVSENLDVISISPSDFERAAQLAENHLLGLKSGDALHLSVAHVADGLCTRDHRFAKAAKALGLDAILI
jgi:predicted nucleic acid-binding protein